MAIERYVVRLYLPDCPWHRPLDLEVRGEGLGRLTLFELLRRALAGSGVAQELFTSAGGRYVDLRPEVYLRRPVPLETLRAGGGLRQLLPHVLPAPELFMDVEGEGGRVHYLPVAVCQRPTDLPSVADTWWDRLWIRRNGLPSRLTALLLIALALYLLVTGASAYGRRVARVGELAARQSQLLASQEVLAAELVELRQRAAALGQVERRSELDQALEQLASALAAVVPPQRPPALLSPLESYHRQLASARQTLDQARQAAALAQQLQDFYASLAQAGAEIELLADDLEGELGQLATLAPPGEGGPDPLAQVLELRQRGLAALAQEQLVAVQAARNALHRLLALRQVLGRLVATGAEAAVQAQARMLAAAAWAQLTEPAALQQLLGLAEQLEQEFQVVVAELDTPAGRRQGFTLAGRYFVLVQVQSTSAPVRGGPRLAIVDAACDLGELPQPPVCDRPGAPVALWAEEVDQEAFALVQSGAARLFAMKRRGQLELEHQDKFRSTAGYRQLRPAQAQYFLEHGG